MRGAYVPRGAARLLLVAMVVAAVAGLARWPRLVLPVLNVSRAVK